MPMPMNKGAKIVINQWCRVKPGEKVLIISDDTHVKESIALWKATQDAQATPAMITIPEDCTQPGLMFDSLLGFFLHHDLVIGATNFSLITTNAVRELLQNGRRFRFLLPPTTTIRCCPSTFCRWTRSRQRNYPVG